MFTWISGVPDDLESETKHDTRVTNARWVTCRNGSLELVIETEYVGPREPGDGHLLWFTKD